MRGRGEPRPKQQHRTDLRSHQLPEGTLNLLGSSTRSSVAAALLACHEGSAMQRGVQLAAPLPSSKPLHLHLHSQCACCRLRWRPTQSVGRRASCSWRRSWLKSTTASSRQGGAAPARALAPTAQICTTLDGARRAAGHLGKASLSALHCGMKAALSGCCHTHFTLPRHPPIPTPTTHHHTNPAQEVKARTAAMDADLASKQSALEAHEQARDMAADKLGTMEARTASLGGCQPGWVPCLRPATRAGPCRLGLACVACVATAKGSGDASGGELGFREGRAARLESRVPPSFPSPPVEHCSFFELPACSVSLKLAGLRHVQRPLLSATSRFTTAATHPHAPGLQPSRRPRRRAGWSRWR